MAGIDYSPKEGYALDGVSQKDAWIHGEDSNKREYLLYNFYTNVVGMSLDQYSGAPVAVRFSTTCSGASLSLS